MSALGTAALGLGSSIISSAFGSLFGDNSAKKQFKYQQELNREAFQHDVDMWNRQNAYNTPSAQMERLQAAGLNPNLVYGNGGATNTANNAPSYNAGSAPDVSSARAAAASLANQGFNTALNFQMQQVQAANLQADTELKNTQGQLNQTNNEVALLDKYLKQNTVDDNIRYQLEKWKQDLVLGRNQIKLGDQQFTLNMYQMKKLDAETGNIIANTKLTKLQAEEIAITLQYLPEVLRSQIHLNNANAYKAIQSGNLDIEKANTERTQQYLNTVTSSLKVTENSLKKATFNDVVNNEHFKSLSAKEQYDVLYAFSWLKSYKDVFGSDGIAGSVYNPIMMNRLQPNFPVDNSNHYDTEAEKAGFKPNGDGTYNYHGYRFKRK